jgi:hypothetical protein
MDFVSRIEELKVQHHAIETALENRIGQMKSDENEVHNLKKKKLQIKDEIARLS